MLARYNILLLAPLIVILSHAPQAVRTLVYIFLTAFVGSSITKVSPQKHVKHCDFYVKFLKIRTTFLPEGAYCLCISIVTSKLLHWLCLRKPYLLFNVDLIEKCRGDQRATKYIFCKILLVGINKDLFNSGSFQGLSIFCFFSTFFLSSNSLFSYLFFSIFAHNQAIFLCKKFLSCIRISTF